MARLEISSSDFRGKMGAIFDRADRGEQIIIRRRDKTSYTRVSGLGASTTATVCSTTSTTT